MCAMGLNCNKFVFAAEYSPTRCADYPLALSTAFNRLNIELIRQHALTLSMRFRRHWIANELAVGWAVAGYASSW